VVSQQTGEEESPAENSRGRKNNKKSQIEI